MAGPTVRGRRTEHPNTVVEMLRVEFGKMVDDIERLRARVDAICVKLDADAGVTDTNYAAGTYSGTSRVQAAGLTAGKVETK